ncbi:unnamed protein product, partial [Fusarium graminearum]
QKEASQPATIEGQFVPKQPVSSSHSATGLELSRYGAHDPTLGFPGMLYRTINNWKGTSPRQTKLFISYAAVGLSWTWNIKLSPGSSTRERFKPCVLSRALAIQTN